MPALGKARHSMKPVLLSRLIAGMLTTILSVAPALGFAIPCPHCVASAASHRAEPVASRTPTVPGEHSCCAKTPQASMPQSGVSIGQIEQSSSVERLPMSAAIEAACPDLTFAGEPLEGCASCCLISTRSEPVVAGTNELHLERPLAAFSVAPIVDILAVRRHGATMPWAFATPWAQAADGPSRQAFLCRFTT
jgi:hypothetical protein